MLRIGYGYFQQEDVRYLKIEKYNKTAYVYLKSDAKPIELYPVEQGDVEIITKGEEAK
jgi:hypothetical protein